MDLALKTTQEDWYAIKQTNGNSPSCSGFKFGFPIPFLMISVKLNAPSNSSTNMYSFCLLKFGNLNFVRLVISCCNMASSELSFIVQDAFSTKAHSFPICSWYNLSFVPIRTHTKFGISTADLLAGMCVCV